MVEPVSFPGRFEAAPAPAPQSRTPDPVPLPLPRVQVPEGLLPTGQSSEPAPEQRKAEPVEQRPDPQHEAQRMQVLQNLMEGLTGRYEFGLLKESGQFYVKVIDRSTNKIIETRPFREFLEAKERIASGVGMFLDENV